MSGFSLEEAIKQLVADLEGFQQQAQGSSGPFSPAQVPLEGGTRVKLSGSGFVEGTTLTVGTASIQDLAITPVGDAVFFTAPPMPEGPVDVAPLSTNNCIRAG